MRRGKSVVVGWLSPSTWPISWAIVRDRDPISKVCSRSSVFSGGEFPFDGLSDQTPINTVEFVSVSEWGNLLKRGLIP